MLANAKSIASRLKAARLALGLNQVELCRAINCTTNRWNQYETGARRITLTVASNFCDTYGFTLDWIYRDDASGLPQRLHKVLANDRAA